MAFIIFLQGDFNENKINLYRYIPDELLEKETEFSTEEVNLLNLRIMGNSVHVVSQDSSFECYYPEKFSFKVNENESAMFMEDGKIYFQTWLEDGLDMEGNCATDRYNFYNKVVVKDYSGNVLSKESGCLHQAADGVWWIA